MKKKILILVSLMLPCAAFARVTEPPQNVRFEKGVYALYMSPNGKWVGSTAGDASIYNVETGENIYHDGIYMGIGNSMADNGMGASDANDRGTIMYNGKTIYPEALNPYWFSDINCITPDATRVAGTCNNPTLGDPLMYVPFVADLDEDGQLSNFTILPYPEVDFFRARPQLSNVVCISDDGKTCMGEMRDWRGMFTVPIYYQQDANGQWSYTLPTEDLFNPTGIEIPDNPWLAEPFLPEPQDLMSPMMAEAYDNDYSNWLANGGATEMPDYADYMTDEQYEQYKEAVEKYNEWYYSSEEKIKEYVPIYKAVLESTPSFSGNDAMLHPDGSYFLTPGGVEDEEGNHLTYLYKIYTDGVTPMEHFSMPNRGLFPKKILTDGTAILTKGIRAVPDTYFMLPETNEFVHVYDYLRPEYPEVVEWLEINFPNASGVVLTNNDKTIFSGALIPDQFADFDEYNDYYYHSYFFSNLEDWNGVEEIIAETPDGVYTVYDLKGVKVLETKDASALNSLPKGIYIVNNKKIYIP